MSRLVLENVPDTLHLRLKEQAARNHRSLTGEAMMILDAGVGGQQECDLPEPFEGKHPITDESIQQARREGRE